MYELLTYRAAFGQPSGSPFCVKAMCLLNMAGVDWSPVIQDDPRKMPFAKLPVLRLRGGRLIADSENIRAHLETEHGIDFDEGLTDRDRAASRALIRMAEEHLYFFLVQDRWGNDAVWPSIRDAYFAAIPALLRKPVSAMLRRDVLKTLKGQGVGRFTEEQRLARIEPDLQALATLLGDRAFLFGDAPSAADASLGPVLMGMAASPVPTGLSKRVGGDPVLSAYATRVAEALYP